MFGQDVTNSQHKVSQLMDTTGDGTGTAEMARASAVYKCKPPTGKEYTLARMNVYIESGQKFRGDGYGSASPLTNGIDITIRDAAGSLFRYTPQAIKRIGHWHLLAGVDMDYTDATAGNSVASIRWSFYKGSGLTSLNGDRGEFLQVETRDAMDHLVSHLIQIQGVQRNI